MIFEGLCPVIICNGVDATNLNDALSRGTEAFSSTTEVSGEARQLVGQLQSQLGVTKTQAVGGTSAMIQQFVPIVMGFLGDQGVSASLLEQLQNLWAPAG